MPCLSKPLPQTPLEKFARSLRERPESLRKKAYPMSFPMYTVPLESVLEMAEVRPHEALLADGVLAVFDESKGKAIFVSHQWVGFGHPDPDLQQFRVLQDALRGVLAGACSISPDLHTEILLGISKAMSPESLRAQPLFLWYDYFCCPQGRRHPELELAIDSIPAYVSQCDVFVALCPVASSPDLSQVFNRFTWARRGWCRLEHFFWDLTSHGRPVIHVKGSRQLEVTKMPQFLSVGEGAFTFEEDQRKVARILQEAVRGNLLRCLEKGDFVEYRLRLNLQSVRTRGLPYASAPPEDLVPGFEVDPKTDPKASLLARFLYQNGFRHSRERDPLGWSPLCYAAVRGDPALVAALLEEGADPNDAAQGENPEIYVVKRTPVLNLAARFHNHEVMKLLLSRRADVESCDTLGCTALHMAAVANDTAGVALLCDAKAKLEAKNMFGVTPLHAACEMCSLEALKELQRRSGKGALERSLISTMVGQASPDVVNWLLDSGADINELFKPPPLSLLSVFLGLTASKDIVRGRGPRTRTALGRVAYHHYKATPLMLAILTGNFHPAAILVRRGARLDLRNYRGVTAMDLAMEMSAPEDLLELMRGEEDFGFKLTRLGSHSSAGACSSFGFSTPTADEAEAEEEDYFEI